MLLKSQRGGLTNLSYGLLVMDEYNSTDNQ